MRNHHTPKEPPQKILERIKRDWDIDTTSGIVTQKSTGKRIGVLNNNGYRHIGVGYAPKINLAVAHLVWWKHTGEWPKLGIDHRNRNRDDNRISNLQVTTQSRNMLNTEASLHRSGSKQQASMYHKGKRIFLGLFDTTEEAERARAQKQKELNLRVVNPEGE